MKQDPGNANYSYQASFEEAIEKRHNNALSIVTHDLKSPMTAIIGFAQFLESEMVQENAPPSWIKLINKIREAGLVTNTLIEDITEMAKMEAGKEEVEPTWVYDLESELNEAINTFRFQAKSKNIELSVRIKNPLPSVRWDIRRIKNHVLNNLISNALKFTPLAGKVTLTAESGRDSVSLIVADTGPGIPEGEHDKIFNRYEHPGLKSGRISMGAGLGLYNARLFVSHHGGKISLDTSVDKGATFRIDLPFDAVDAGKTMESCLSTV